MKISMSVLNCFCCRKATNADSVPIVEEVVDERVREEINFGIQIHNYEISSESESLEIEATFRELDGIYEDFRAHPDRYGKEWYAEALSLFQEVNLNLSPKTVMLLGDLYKQVQDQQTALELYKIAGYLSQSPTLSSASSESKGPTRWFQMEV